VEGLQEEARHGQRVHAIFGAKGRVGRFERRGTFFCWPSSPPLLGNNTERARPPRPCGPGRRRGAGPAGSHGSGTHRWMTWSSSGWLKKSFSSSDPAASGASPPPPAGATRSRSRWGMQGSERRKQRCGMMVGGWHGVSWAGVGRLGARAAAVGGWSGGAGRVRVRLQLKPSGERACCASPSAPLGPWRQAGDTSGTHRARHVAAAFGLWVGGWSGRELGSIWGRPFDPVLAVVI
jgi:hypothetical protein